MTRIAPVNLMYSPKTLWFQAGDFDIPVGEHVVVTTARGTEFGTVAEPFFEATEEQLESLKSELKPVLRVATEEDCEAAEAMAQKNLETMPLFREVVEEEGIDMRPVSIEFLLEGDKAVFYFEADERVDFRELVRKLAAKLHIRIEMRQIGVRDEARLIGGLGHCGQELCCKRLGGEFNPVSIRMAKEQNLSLNPEKISGLCGRLMCCLRYEYDAYKEFHGRCPKVGATVVTPEGDAKVSELDVPREIVTLKTEEGKTVRIPLAKMETAEGSERPNVVPREAWDIATGIGALSGLTQAMFLTSQFVGEDKLADKTAPQSTGSKRRRGSTKLAASGNAGAGSNAAGNSVRQPQSKATRNTKASDAGAEEEKAAKRRPRRRRGGRANATAASAQDTAVQVQVGSPNTEAHQPVGLAQSAQSAQPASLVQSVRPGRNSSALRASREDAGRTGSIDYAAAEGKAAESGAKPERRSRRGRRGSGSSAHANQQTRIVQDEQRPQAAKGGKSPQAGQQRSSEQSRQVEQRRQAEHVRQAEQPQATTVNVNRNRRRRTSHTITPSDQQGA